MKVVLGPYKDGAIVVEVSGVQARKLEISQVCVVSVGCICFLAEVLSDLDPPRLY